ncbi:MAG TPA: hypothetical protein VFK13_12100 [Gemmatimonadaceae bacterium]|nr:hypothetical protein [Gemmatimonadaceae bacterium]
MRALRRRIRSVTLLAAAAIAACDQGWTYHQAPGAPTTIPLRASSAPQDDSATAMSIYVMNASVFSIGLGVDVYLFNQAGAPIALDSVSMVVRDARGRVLVPSSTYSCTEGETRPPRVLAPVQSCQVSAQFEVNPGYPLLIALGHRNGDLERLTATLSVRAGDRRGTVVLPLEWDDLGHVR